MTIDLSNAPTWVVCVVALLGSLTLFVRLAGPVLLDCYLCLSGRTPIYQETKETVRDIGASDGDKEHKQEAA